MRNLISVRAARASLRRGDYARLTVDEARGAYAFTRTFGEERTLVVLNTTDRSQELELPVGDLWTDGHSLRSLVDHRPLAIQKGKLKLSLPPWGGEWLG